MITKNNKILLLALIALFIVSCNQDEGCIEAEYDEYIILEEGNDYCLPNGDSFTVSKLENAFCPCDVICVWEGEMLLHYEGEFNGIQVDTFVGSNDNTDKLFGSGNHEIQFINIEFVEPCSETLPSPEIVRSTAVISLK